MGERSQEEKPERLRLKGVQGRSRACLLGLKAPQRATARAERGRAHRRASACCAVLEYENVLRLFTASDDSMHNPTPIVEYLRCMRIILTLPVH